MKNDAGNKKYVIYLSNEHDFTHTIEDDSKTLGEIYLIRRTRKARYENHDLRDVVFDEETQTLVTFMGDRQGRHTFSGRIIKKRPKHNHYDVKNIKVYLVLIEPGIFGCDNVPSLDSGVDGNSEYTLAHGNRGIGSPHGYNGWYGWNIDNRPIPSIVFSYDLNTNIEANPIPSLLALLAVTIYLFIFIFKIFTLILSLYLSKIVFIYCKIYKLI